MVKRLLLACLVALLLPATAQATAPTLTKAGSVLSWSAVSGATKYQIGLWYVSPSKCTTVEPCFTQSTTATTFNENEILSGWTYAFEVREKEPVVGEWSNRVEISYPVVSEDAGHVAYMWDFASWADQYTGLNTGGPFNVEWFSSRASYGWGYPPSDNAYPGWFPAIALQGYRDWYTEKRNLWEAGPREGYEAIISTDMSHGYKGPEVDDANWSSGFQKIGTSQALWNEGELRTLEGIRASHPSARIEMNSQFADIWPRIKEGNTTVLKAVEQVNGLFKEYGWGPSSSGVGTSTGYRESLEYVDWLHEHGKSLTAGWDYSHNDIGTEEYTLATLLLATKLGDHVDYYHQHPAPEELWAHLFNMDLGEPLGARTRSSEGLWERDFSKGRAYTVEPGGAEAHITLPESLENSKGEHVTSVTLKAGQGAVLAK